MSDELKQLARVLDGIAEGKEWEYLGDVSRQEMGWFTAQPGESPLVYIGLNREIRLKPESQKVPLGPEDVTPGSVIKGPPNNPGRWSIVTTCGNSGVTISHISGVIKFADLVAQELQIKRPGEDWKPCWKEVKV